MAAKGIADRVHAVHFHKWCRSSWWPTGKTCPPTTCRDDKMADMVQRVITGVDRRQIPSGQYQAVLIDEGHDFAPEWLRLVVQMVDPATNSLLVLYDDAQSIYDRTQKSKNFSFKSVGIQAQGRTTILKINYRNTRQILQTASLVAADLLTAEDKDDDGVPLLKPVSCGRDGEAPLIVRLPTLREEVAQVAELLATAHREGHAWADMAILCRHHSEMDMCAEFLRKRKLPHQLRRNSSSVFDPAHDSIKVMTLHVSKGLEFPVVALVGAGRMPAEGEDEREEARLFYVGATRATQRLVIGVGTTPTVLALVRLHYESVVRSLWYAAGATDEWIDRMKLENSDENGEPVLGPPVDSMLNRLGEVLPSHVSASLRVLKEASWKPMNSFVHGGVHAILTGSGRRIHAVPLDRGPEERQRACDHECPGAGHQLQRHEQPRLCWQPCSKGI
jgi:hypothetical protein